MILTGILQALVGLFILGLLVLIHELGHFLAAKRFKVRVIAFSIGFGKPLIRWIRGETEYRLCAIPMGGYVRMAGEQPEDNRTWKDDEFPAKPVWQRAIIAIAGPAFNIIFAIIFLWIAFMMGVERPLYFDKARIGAVADSSSAALAGIQPGDIVLSMNGRLVGNWMDVEKAFSRLEERYTLVVERNGQTRTATVNGAQLKSGALPKEPTAGLMPCIPPVIGGVNPSSPAEKAGMQSNDSVIAINGNPIISWLQLTGLVQKYDSTTGALTLTIVRKGQVHDISVVPAFSEKEKRYLVGISMATPPGRIVRSGPTQAMELSIERTKEIIVQIFDVLGKLFSHQVSPRQLAGPVGIVQMSGGIALMGVVHILEFMALIGINLGLLNLLPLVITDGGLLLFLFIEALRGKPLPVKYQSIIGQIAVAFFVFLFIYVTFNDIGRIPEVFKMTGK